MFTNLAILGPCKYMSYWNMAIEEFDDLLVKHGHFFQRYLMNYQRDPNSGRFYQQIWAAKIDGCVWK